MKATQMTFYSMTALAENVNDTRDTIIASSYVIINKMINEDRM